jgi:hypothetical protein
MVEDVLRGLGWYECGEFFRTLDPDFEDAVEGAIALHADAGDTPENDFVEAVPVFWCRGGFDGQECPGNGGRKCRSRSEGGGQGWWVNGVFFAGRWWLRQIEVSEFQIE